MFYAMETLREIATDTRHDSVYNHVAGEVLFESAKVHEFETKKARDEYVEHYDRAPQKTVTSDGEEVSRHEWTARAIKRAEAMKHVKENPYIYG